MTSVAAFKGNNKSGDHERKSLLEWSACFGKCHETQLRLVAFARVKISSAPGRLSLGPSAVPQQSCNAKLVEE